MTSSWTVQREPNYVQPMVAASVGVSLISTQARGIADDAMIAFKPPSAVSIRAKFAKLAEMEKANRLIVTIWSMTRSPVDLFVQRKQSIISTTLHSGKPFHKYCLSLPPSISIYLSIHLSLSLSLSLSHHTFCSQRSRKSDSRVKRRDSLQAIHSLSFHPLSLDNHYHKSTRNTRLHVLNKPPYWHGSRVQ